MSDAATTPTAAWPLAPGEHPDLPRLHCELHPGAPAGGTARRPVSAVPPTARYLFGATRVIHTASPDRIRSHAAQLLDLADALEAAHLDHTTGQLDLDDGGR